MKKILQSLTAIVCATAISSAMAAKVTCPSPDKIRELANFTYVYKSQVQANQWNLVSQPFTYDNQTWGVTYVFFSMLSPDNPAQYLIEEGLERFNRSPFMINPTVLSDGNATSCLYAPPDSQYVLVAENPPQLGFAKK